MALYTLYRPRDWNSVISQDYITTILRNSLKSGRFSHAYLFHGSRGTGKTTSARIFAKALNCTQLQEGNPCHTCANCVAFDNDAFLDVIEIDGASNNGVENVRELIEKARFEPNQGKYKIYIIDEVHMLSQGAFNALLKTLEEPPKHVIFILATTEVDKVPETIRSRTLRFDFRKISLDDIKKRLLYVCQSEEIVIEDAALDILAGSARGGLRDALTLLEQNTIDKTVSTEYVRNTLSLVEDSLIDATIEALATKDLPGIMRIIDSLKERHIQVRAFFDQIMYRLRDQMIAHLEDADFALYDLLLSEFESSYEKIRYLPDGMMLIELTLIRIAKRNNQNTTADTPSFRMTSPKIVSPKEKVEPLPDATNRSNFPAPKQEEVPVRVSSPQDKEVSTPQKSSGGDFSFPRLITELKDTHPALMIDLKTARFRLDEHVLTLIFSKKWNHDRVNTPTIKNLLCEVLERLFGESWQIQCELSDTSHTLAQAAHEVF